MPTIEKFQPTTIGEKPWGEEWLIAHTPQYIGKMLLMKAGGTGNLQYHERKVETFFLYTGEALVEFQEADGSYRQVRMLPGEAYHVPAGAVHRVEALTPCVFFEASTPVFEDRVKVER